MNASKTPRPLPPDEDASQWLRLQKPGPAAETCIRYALAFNTLDIDWLAHAFSPFVNHQSQSSLNTVTGRRQVMKHLQAKIEKLRQNPATRARFELATTETGEPCAAVFQAQGAFDRNWLAEPIATVVLGVDGPGLIISILVVTVLPLPSRAIRSGIYPGIEGEVHERPREIIRPGTDYQGLEFVFFLLDGEMGLDRDMMQTAEAALTAFPGAGSRVIVTDNGVEDEIGELMRMGFTGFPSVAVYYRDEVIYRQQGLISATVLVEAIRDATKLYVAH